jgi:uncharacterized membrane protein YGL010W
MSRFHFLFRDVPMDAWVDRYEKSHQNPINRVFHTFGIPMIAVSIPLFLIAPLIRILGNSVVVVYGRLDLPSAWTPHRR